MIVYDGALARLGLSEGDACGFSKGFEFLMGFAITDAAAADQQGLFRGANDRRSLRQGLRLRQPPGQAMDPLLEEGLGVVVCFALHVLGDSQAHRAGVGWVRQHPEGGEESAHELLGTDDAVPIAADGSKGVVGGDGQVVDLLDLLQHRVRLAAGVHVAGQDQHRDIVGGGGGGSGDHVGGAGAYGGGHGDDLFALHLLGESHGGMGHALLVLALPDLQAAGLLPQRLPQAHHVAVAGQHDDTFHEGVLHAVIGDVLVLQKTYQGLGHGQANGLHASLLMK